MTQEGRGYPSIDSLKEISNYFSVSIDDLLSGEKLISIAENENKNNIHGICDSMIGIVDVCALLLIILPLYPNIVDGYVYSVNLFVYDATDFSYIIHWIMFITMILTGMLKIVLTKLQLQKFNKIMTCISIVLGILTVLFLAMTGEAYAITVAFLLLVIKGIIKTAMIKVSF